MSERKEDLANKEVCRFLILFQHVMTYNAELLNTAQPPTVLPQFALFKYGYKQLPWLEITSIFMLIQIKKVKSVLWVDGWMGWFDMTEAFFKKRYSCLNDGSNRSIFLLSSVIKDSFRKPLPLQLDPNISVSKLFHYGVPPLS